MKASTQYLYFVACRVIHQTVSIRVAFSHDIYKDVMFSNDISFLRSLRDLGIGAINRLPALRRSFIREAAGLTGDLPRLMQ